MVYHPQRIEKKWQDRWDQETWFQAQQEDPRPKYYILDMFPYPSSDGLHVGHPEGYTATDILARYKRARGFNVLHPMGWDAFGLPAEQYAIKTGVHPAVTTEKAIENFRRQIKSLGLSYDWSREISTCDPGYYRWTQFLFLQLYERGLAYQKEVSVNWCPALKTVLANEEVENGLSERGKHPVYRVPMKQWMLKITAYAERLLSGLDSLDWPESTKELQRHWIGRSEGIQFHFMANGLPVSIFTTRPETLWGVTYLILAPEHPLVSLLTHLEQLESVRAYQQQASQKSEVARQGGEKEKTGVFTGSYATHPVTQKLIPIWIADYVLLSYGTGAVMGVPGHDERDHEFALHYSLPIQTVIKSNSDGKSEVLVDSGFLTGLSPKAAQHKIMDWIEEKGLGKRTVQYKLRDWLFSRQRYWGEPFPVVYLEDGSQRGLNLDELPVVLPHVLSYEPSEKGESPLASFQEWLWTTDSKTGQKLRRETDTMPGSAGSSWYFLRFCDPHNQAAPFSFEAQKQWMPVDLYLGGAEHAVGHLLYARFWTQVLYDLGWVSYPEPFQKLVHQGMILGDDHEKMSKSRGNVINPDHIIQQYGADTLRLYEMFMGPLEQDKPWSTSAIEGVSRFLNRVWRAFFSDQDTLLLQDVEPTEEELRVTHQTLRKVTEDIEALRFNTAISQMMIWVNAMTHSEGKPRSCFRIFILLLHPFAPHLAEELWECLGEKSVLSFEPWPPFDPQWAFSEKIKIAIQILGKTRGFVEGEKGLSQAQVEALAKEIPSISLQLEGKTLKKIIFVPDKILNFVFDISSPSR